MIFEALLVVLALVLGWSIFSVTRHRGRGNVVGITVAAAMVLASAASSYHFRIKESRAHPPTDRPIQVELDDYVSSQACRACHPSKYHSWYASYHRTMTQPATPETVAGNFDGILQLKDQFYKLEQRGDELWVEMDDPEWRGEGTAPRIERQIVLLTGSHHKQVYWYPTGRGRELARIPLVYRIAEQRWIPHAAAFLFPPSAIPGTGTGRWNQVCINCHTTNGQSRLHPDGAAPDSRVGEFGISCEACHGPAQAHVRQHQNPFRRYSNRLDDAPDSTIVEPSDLLTQLDSQVCGRCHSVSEYHDRPSQDYGNFHGYPYRPGQVLTDTRFVVSRQSLYGDERAPIAQAILNEPNYLEERFWSDGMVRVSGREYNGLIESPCYKRGTLSCFSCHQMHKEPDDPRPMHEWTDDQLKIGMRGDQACLQCHDTFAAKIAQHSYHKVSSSGSRCQNCHMPHTTYGVLKAIRSHQIDNPSVQSSLETGRPNACNQCHLDKTLAWTAHYLDEWYDIPQPELTRDQREIAASVLWTLTGDAGQRALMAWNFGWEDAQATSGTQWIAPYLAQLISDPYDAVRYIAYRSLRDLPAFRNFEYDFMADPDTRFSVAQRALGVWSRTPFSMDPAVTPPVLIVNGVLQGEEFERLYGLRDNRRVVLKE